MTLVHILGFLMKVLLRVGEIRAFICGMLVEDLFQMKVMKRMWSHLYMNKMLIKVHLPIPVSVLTSYVERWVFYIFLYNGHSNITFGWKL